MQEIKCDTGYKICGGRCIPQDRACTMRESTLVDEIESDRIYEADLSSLTLDLAERVVTAAGELNSLEEIPLMLGDILGDDIAEEVSRLKVAFAEGIGQLQEGMTLTMEVETPGAEAAYEFFNTEAGDVIFEVEELEVELVDSTRIRLRYGT